MFELLPWWVRWRVYERREARRRKREILYRGGLERDGYRKWAREVYRRVLEWKPTPISAAVQKLYSEE